MLPDSRLPLETFLVASSSSLARLAMETGSASTLQSHGPHAEKTVSADKDAPGPAELQNESETVAKADATGADDFPDGGLRGALGASKPVAKKLTCNLQLGRSSSARGWSAPALSVIFPRGACILVCSASAACLILRLTSLSHAAYYEGHQLAGENPSNISWIGSLQLFGIFFWGAPAGYLFDAGYYRGIFIAGSILIVVGCVTSRTTHSIKLISRYSVFTTAECTKLWHFILAQALVPSVGYGLVFIPSAAVLGHWFKKRRAVAFGVIATGAYSHCSKNAC